MNDDLQKQVAEINEPFFRQQGDRIRAIAKTADPFTKSRLLALAQSYDQKRDRQPERVHHPAISR